MYLSFFIKNEEIKVLQEIKNVLEVAGFEDIQSEGRPEKHRIIIFNGRENNDFRCAAHRLTEEAPSEAKDCPFLIRVGSEWTIEALTRILSGYINFTVHDFIFLHYPKERDFHRNVEERFLEKISAMKLALVHCRDANTKQVEIFEDIIESAKNKTIAKVKREILYFLIEHRIKFPWGHGPTKIKHKISMIEWLKKAHENFPKKSSENLQKEKVKSFTLKI